MRRLCAGFGFGAGTDAHRVGPQFGDDGHDLVEPLMQPLLAMQVAGERDIAQGRQALCTGFCVLAQAKCLRKHQHARTRARLLLVVVQMAVHGQTVGLVMDDFGAHADLREGALVGVFPILPAAGRIRDNPGFGGHCHDRIDSRLALCAVGSRVRLRNGMRRLREEIEEMLMAVVEGDSSLLTSVITRLGQAPPGMDHSALAADVADFVSQYAHQRFDEFPLAAALNEMTEIIRRYHIMLPARVAMLTAVRQVLRNGLKLMGAEPVEEMN